MSQDRFADVRKFMLGPAQQTVPDAPIERIDAATRVDMLQRLDWLLSECEELRLAILTDDIPGIVDGAIDVSYVAEGFHVRVGVNSNSIWDATQASNMTKVPGDASVGFKAQKPEGYQHADIAGEIEKQRIAARAKGGAE